MQSDSDSITNYPVEGVIVPASYQPVSVDCTIVILRFVLLLSDFYATFNLMRFIGWLTYTQYHFYILIIILY